MSAIPASNLSHQNSGPVCVVPGDVLSTTVTSFQQITAPVVAQMSAGKTLTIDLRAARLVDSVGLNALVSVIKQIRASGARATIWVGHDNVRRILAFTRIDTHAKVEGPYA